MKTIKLLSIVACLFALQWASGQCNLPAQFYVGSNGYSASFSQPDTIFTGQTYWSFPGGTPSADSGNYANVTYTTLGTHTACMVVVLDTCRDTICQDFTLTPGVYNISGSVAISGSGACAAVYLIRQDTAGHLVLVDSIPANTAAVDTGGTCSGFYEFVSLPIDTYYVKAALAPSDPNYNNYLPTYFGDVLHWSDATAIALVSGSAGADIHLVEGANPGGPGFVAGWVTEGAGLLPNGQPNNTTRSVGQHLPYVQINLLNENGQAVAYTYSDSTGHYQINGLAYGTYQIYAEQLNKAAVPDTFTLSALNPSDANVNFVINSNSAVATGINETGNLFINNIYPNPVISELEMQVTCQQSSAGILKLTDDLGRVVMQQNVQLTSGINTNKVNMQNFAAGIYELVLQTPAGNASFKVVKAK